MRYQPHNPRACADCPTVITGHGNRKRCDDCREKANRAAQRRFHMERTPEEKARHLARCTENRRRRNYGISPEQFAKMSENGCESCGTRDSGRFGFCVDHCHKTGQVRGCLCNHCNRALGLLRDDPVVVMKLLQYIGDRACT